MKKIKNERFELELLKVELKELSSHQSAKFFSCVNCSNQYKVRIKLFI